MHNERFERAFATLLVDESGPEAEAIRGFTRFTIDLEQLRSWYYDPLLTVDDLKVVDQLEAAQLVHDNCWIKSSAELLPHGLDYYCFDSTFRFGQMNTMRWLNLACGLDSRANLFQSTFEALRKLPLEPVIVAMDLLIRRRLKSHAQWTENKHWWTNRCNRARDRALKVVNRCPTEPQLLLQK